jgi:protein phosphatase
MDDQPMTGTADIATSCATPDLRHIHGPFDIVGDVHGCAGELTDLLVKLGYCISFDISSAGRSVRVTPPNGRQLIFVGDLVDRGPRSPDVLRIVMATSEGGFGYCVPGNHDIKFLRYLQGKPVKINHGLDKTVEQFEGEHAEFSGGVKKFFEGLPYHLWLANGTLAIAHAGIRDHMLGHVSAEIRSFCLYGETSGETDEFGLPIRYHWAAEYHGRTAIIYGHTPVPEAGWVNNTLCIDTGCCFGGRLTALRWPERQIVSVPAAAVYAKPIRPFGHPPVRHGPPV